MSSHKKGSAGVCRHFPLSMFILLCWYKLESTTQHRFRLLVLLLLTSGLAAAFKTGFSQNKVHAPLVTLGAINGNYTTRDSILQAKGLICHDAGCEVKSFNIMILPADRYIIGPYWIPGNRLTEKMLDTLKKLPNLRTRVFIDSIQITTGNREMQVPGIALQFDH